ncbi:hypothetical protein ACB092_11G138700 [Castanea dentata]
MEVLSRILKKIEECNLIWGFQVGVVNSAGVSISHLLFADDTIIFCEVSREQLTVNKNPILEKMEKRLSGWKRLYLPKGGRLIIQRNFLWGSSEGGFKYPLMAWDKVCLPVEMGGLGLRKVVPFNQALLGKWLWRYGHEDTHLWRRVISTKYGEDQGGWRTRDCRRSHGCGLRRSFNEGEGTRIRFWHDRWIGDVTLKVLYPELYVCLAVKDACISEVL